MLWLQIAVPALLAAGVTVLLTPVTVRLAERVRAVDIPGGRKRHERPIPRLGGIAIAGGIVLSLGPSLILLTDSGQRGSWLIEMSWFGVGAMIVFVLGLVDDIRPVGPLVKLFFQAVAASLLVAIGWQFSALRLPWEGSFPVEAAAPVLSVLWVIGVTNAINLIDGLDGLAAGIVAIIASSLLVLAILQPNREMLIVSACIVGACVGFLRHNWRPAKIFMGDSGSLLLGFILAAITLRTSVKASATVTILVPILALGLPVIDTLLVMWYRFLRGHPTMSRVAGIFHGDRKHLHHLLLETRVARSRVLLTLYGLAVLFCLMALLVAVSGDLRLALTFLIIEVLAVVLIRKAGLTAEARRQSEQRLTRLSHDHVSAATRGSGGSPPAVARQGEQELEKAPAATE